MKFPRSLLLVVVFVFTSVSFGQETATQTVDEKEQKLRESAVVFLRETYSDVGNMRSLENRISFTSELAALLWYHDKAEASAMFGRTVSDFKQLLGTYDAQMNALGPVSGPPSLGMMDMFLGEPGDAQKIAKKFRAAMGVRQQIALAIAEHEPDLAYNFFHDSMNIITNAEFRKQLEASDANYEQQLISRIAAADAKKGVELGQRSLPKGFTASHVELLRRLHSKDPDAAVSFGAAILSKVKDTSLDKLDSYATRSLLSFGDGLREKTVAGKPAKLVYTPGQLSEIADLLARKLLDAKVEDHDPMPDTSMIEKYAPGRAAQLKAKYSDTEQPKLSVYSATNPPPPSVAVASSSGSASANALGSPIGSASPESVSDEETMAEGLEKLNSKELPKEERERVVAQARNILMRTPGRASKISGLSTLAASVSAAGDKELASELMREAAGLVNPQPKNYQDLMFTLMLAAGYASAEPDKAFPVLEDTIFRANQLISAVVTLAEFADVNEEIIADGEFQVGAFGGQMIRSMTGSVGMADPTIKQLIDADFEKTKALTNRFDRGEVRVLAKVMVLRSILGKKQAASDMDFTEMDMSDF
jgi:hypothetical protein